MWYNKERNGDSKIEDRDGYHDYDDDDKDDDDNNTDDNDEVDDDDDQVEGDEVAATRGFPSVVQEKPVEGPG